MLRICTIDNLSAAAYRLETPGFAVELDAAPPTECYRRMAAGACDAALLPVARLAELQDRVTPLGRYGIACRGSVRSVLLFARVPLERIARERRPILVTGKSQTSRELLRHLFQMEFGRPPWFTGQETNAAAQLLIGEDALGERQRRRRWPIVRDLGQWWYRQTGLPFVFARWVARRDLPDAKRTLIQQWLSDNAARAESAEGRARLLRRGLRAGLGEPFLRAYHHEVRPRLTPEDLTGLETFLRLRETEKPCAKIA